MPVPDFVHAGPGVIKDVVLSIATHADPVTLGKCRRTSGRCRNCDAVHDTRGCLGGRKRLPLAEVDVV